jgi:hypothetical protein
MSFTLPEESVIVDGLYRLNCEIFGYEDVRTFLITNTPDKRVADRFISWCIQLRVIPGQRQKWGTALYLKAQSYFELCDRELKKRPRDPLFLIPTEFDTLIRTDIAETRRWFHSICLDCGLSPSEVDDDDFDLRLQRIYAIQTLASPDSKYTVGLVRVGSVCLAMACTFCKHAGIGLDFGEAIAYHMTCVVSSLIPARRLLDDRQRFVAHFEASDQAMRQLRPDLFGKLVTGTLGFGMKWEMTLFAGSHSGVEILNLWDQIFGRLERLPEFIQAVTIAHVIQLQVEEIDGVVDAKETQRWDLGVLIGDATRILTHERSCREAFCAFMCPWLKQYHGFQVRKDW